MKVTPQSTASCRCLCRQLLAGLLPDDVLGVPVRPVRIVLAAPLRLQQRSRQRVRLQAGFPKPHRVAVAPQAKYRKQPHAKYQAVAGTDALGQYLTRRANQWHSFIIAQSVKRPWA